MPLVWVIGRFTNGGTYHDYSIYQNNRLLGVVTGMCGVLFAATGEHPMGRWKLYHTEQLFESVNVRPIFRHFLERFFQKLAGDFDALEVDAVANHRACVGACVNTHFGKCIGGVLQGTIGNDIVHLPVN